MAIQKEEGEMFKIYCSFNPIFYGCSLQISFSVAGKIYVSI